MGKFNTEKRRTPRKHGGKRKGTGGKDRRRYQTQWERFRSPGKADKVPVLICVQHLWPNNYFQYGYASGIAAPSFRGEDAPQFTFVAVLWITACPPPISLEKSPCSLI
jgi:hypothetical protein